MADKSVTTMTPAQKLTEAMWRSRSLVGGEVSSVVEQMLSPQAIGYLLAFEAAYTVSLFFGVGELATAIMVIVGVIFVGEEVIEIFDSLHEFVKKATGAKASKDLDEAAKDFAHAMTLGVDIVVALLMRRRGRAHGPEQVVRAKSGGGGNKRRPGSTASGSSGSTAGAGRVGGSNRPPAPKPKGVPRRKRKNSTKTRKQRAKTNADNMDTRKGGHSKEKHGTQVTPQQHEDRLRHGKNPKTGQVEYDRRGRPIRPQKVSSFDSDQKHLEALGKADNKLDRGIADGSWRPQPDGSYKVEVDVPNAGTSYGLNPPRDYTNGTVTSTKVHKATAIYRPDPVTGKPKLVTLYPNP